MNWIELQHEEQLDQLKRDNALSLVFKHSTRCSISHMALKLFEREWNPSVPVNTYFLDLLKYKGISNKIADDFSVYHESPQILLIRNGECIYDASHQDISAVEIEQQLA